MAIPIPQDYILFTFDDFEGGSGGGQKLGDLLAAVLQVSAWMNAFP